MAHLLNSFYGLEVELWTDLLRVLGSNPAEGQKYMVLEKLVVFFILEKFIFSTENRHSSNTFWLYQPGGRICTLSEEEPFEIKNFDLGHPVIQWMVLR